MFTGLVEDVGRLAARRSRGQAGQLTVHSALPLAEVRRGDSIAVNGACLTVEAVDAGAGTLSFHTLSETLSRTNLGRLPAGAAVNLERAMRLGDRLGGHLVLGHVDATARLLAVTRRADDTVVRVELPGELRELVIPKGSVAVDGISLTLAALGDDWFEVHIIPHTWEATNLRAAVVGGWVNLEADMVGKYVLRRQSLAGRELGEEDLRRAGF